MLVPLCNALFALCSGEVKSMIVHTIPALHT